MKIMVCIDGSDKSRYALEKAVSFFKSQNPGIMLLLVAEEPLDASMENEEVFEQWRKECHDILNETAKEVTQHGLEVDAILATGDPRSMIMEAINTKSPDMVVMAKRGKGSVKNMLLGSVTTFVVRQADCPVLTVKMPD